MEPWETIIPPSEGVMGVTLKQQRRSKVQFVLERSKFILAAIAAVLVIFLDEATAQSIVAALGALLVYVVPNAE